MIQLQKPYFASSVQEMLGNTYFLTFYPTTPTYDPK